MTPCSDVVGYQRFGGPCSLHLQGEMSWAWIKIQVEIFWAMTPRSDVVGYQRFGGPCHHHLQGEAAGMTENDIDISWDWREAAGAATQ
jgi:hypothetical protein